MWVEDAIASPTLHTVHDRLDIKHSILHIYNMYFLIIHILYCIYIYLSVSFTYIYIYCIMVGYKN